MHEHWSGLRLAVATATLLGATALGHPARAEDCSGEYSSTFDLIQRGIFAQHGCTSAACHSGPAAQGGLDLASSAAYDNLVDQPPQSVPEDLHPGLRRVVPGSKGRSLLWLNLAAATLPELWTAPRQPMPLAGFPPLDSDELAVVQLWIEYGAPRDGVVPGTAELLDACLPPLRPLETKPLPPPPEGTGIQLRAPRQVLGPNSEREVCFVSYFDITDRVPERFWGPDGKTFRYKGAEARQDPLSHHAVVIVYEGDTPIDSPLWGEFECRGGAHDGERCNAKDLAACGDDGVCASPPVQAPACIGFGPGDAGIGTATKSLFSSMAPGAASLDGIYGEAPLSGILVWNSHAFNVTNENAKLDMWLNFEFAAPEEQLRRVESFVDISAINQMQAPAFGVDQVCHHWVAPEGARLLGLTSHTHKRGKVFRIWLGRFACNGGPNHGAACSPLGPEPGLPAADPCAGAPCEADLLPRIGDCNQDLQVSISELILGVSIGLSQSPMTSCPPFDADRDGAVSIAELVTAVHYAIGPRKRDGLESLLYTNLTYADPISRSFDPPLSMPADDALVDERTLTYCATYDNGFIDPSEVKRRSTVPTNGFPCAATHCAEGLVGEECFGSNRFERNDSCDSVPGAGDGFCDACSVGFGLTTDDEMFVLVATFVRE